MPLLCMHISGSHSGLRLFCSYKSKVYDKKWDRWSLFVLGKLKYTNWGSHLHCSLNPSHILSHPQTAPWWWCQYSVEIWKEIKCTDFTVAWASQTEEKNILYDQQKHSSVWAAPPVPCWVSLHMPDVMERRKGNHIDMSLITSPVPCWDFFLSSSLTPSHLSLITLLTMAFF